MIASGYTDIVEALRDVPGVAHADVEPDGDGLGLLRLALAQGVDEVEVASAVGRLLRERFGLGVDAERVQLVEDMDSGDGATGVDPHEDHFHDRETADGDRDPRVGARTATRPAIRRMHIVSAGLQVSAEVTLSLGERSATGHAEGTATSAGVQRAVATAALRSVEDLLRGRARFELDLVEVTSSGANRAALVAVTMLSAAGSEKLTGAAGVREDVRQAVIRATLDALNRRVEQIAG